MSKSGLKSMFDCTATSHAMGKKMGGVEERDDKVGAGNKANLIALSSVHNPLQEPTIKSDSSFTSNSAQIR